MVTLPLVVNLIAFFEYAVDEHCLAQFERAGRYLQSIGDERREHERSRQSPQQSPIAGESCEYERDPVNPRDVEFHPGARIDGHFGHCEHDRENICEGNRAVRTRKGETVFDSMPETILVGVRGNPDVE